MKNNSLKIAVASGCGALIGGSVPFHQNMSIWTVLIGIVLGAIFGWILYDHKLFIETVIKCFRAEVATSMADEVREIINFSISLFQMLGAFVLILALMGLSILIFCYGFIGSFVGFLESANIWFYSKFLGDELDFVTDFLAPVVLTLCFNAAFYIKDIEFSDRLILLQRTWPMLCCPLFFPLVIPIGIGLTIYLAIVAVKVGYRTFLYLQSEPRLLVAISSATGVMVGVIADKYLICGIAGFAISLLGSYVSRKIAKLGSKVLTNKAI